MNTFLRDHAVTYRTGIEVNSHDPCIDQLFPSNRIPETARPSACNRWHLRVRSTMAFHKTNSWKQRWLRHPSYTGFFYWALGTQLVLQNPVSFVLYSVLLWRFFYYRTRSESQVFLIDEKLKESRRRRATTSSILWGRLCRISEQSWDPYTIYSIGDGLEIYTHSRSVNIIYLSSGWS